MANEPSLSFDNVLTIYLTLTLGALRRSTHPERDVRAYGTIGAVQALLEHVGSSSQLTEEQQLIVKDILTAREESLWGKKQEGQA